MANFRAFRVVLETDFIIPHYATYRNFSKASGLSIEVIKKLCSGEEYVTAKIALALSHSFQKSTQFWTTLQTSLNQEKLDQMNMSKERQRSLRPMRH